MLIIRMMLDITESGTFKDCLTARKFCIPPIQEAHTAPNSGSRAAKRTAKNYIGKHKTRTDGYGSAEKCQNQLGPQFKDSFYIAVQTHQKYHSWNHVVYQSCFGCGNALCHRPRSAGKQNHGDYIDNQNWRKYLIQLQRIFFCFPEEQGCVKCDECQKTYTSCYHIMFSPFSLILEIAFP